MHRNIYYLYSIYSRDILLGSRRRIYRERRLLECALPIFDFKSLCAYPSDIILRLCGSPTRWKRIYNSDEFSRVRERGRSSRSTDWHSLIDRHEEPRLIDRSVNHAVHTNCEGFAVSLSLSLAHAHSSLLISSKMTGTIRPSSIHAHILYPPSVEVTYLLLSTDISSLQLAMFVCLRDATTIVTLNVI